VCQRNIEQYRVKTDKPFDKTQDRLRGITNDPNRADDPEYIARLIKQVVTVSVGTVKIVKGLPELDKLEQGYDGYGTFKRMPQR